MAKFNYVARNDAGREERGTIEAKDEGDATGRLRQKNLSVVSLTKAAGGAGGDKELSWWEKANQKPKKATTGELALFTRQLATMLGSGIPLLEAIEILGEQSMESNKGLGEGLLESADMVRSGTSMSDAMANYPKIFPPIYINMIKAGEASGQIDTILDRLAEYMEASESLKREIKSAMTYPVVSLLMVIGITVYLLVGVVPEFEKMFNSMGGDLPGLTVFVTDLSKFMQNNLGSIAIAVVGGFFGIKMFAKTEVGNRVIDNIFLKMPVFGALNQKVAVSRFARTFGTLLASGVPILGALEIVANTAGNKILEDTVMGARETVRNGENISTFLETAWVFPPMVTKMIAIGERSGALEALLGKIADFYEEQVEAMVKGLTSLIEPFMLGTMGVMVGTIVLAIFLPILEMQKKLQ